MVYDSNTALTVNEMTVNAQYILDYLVGQGWTKNAVCGMLGNMQIESTINPGRWQVGYPAQLGSAGGFGLVQWTPSTKYTDWATANGLPYDNMDSELKRILYELANGVQWYATTAYNMTFQQFSVSSDTPENLASAWMDDYERPDPSTSNEAGRRSNARYWYDNLGGSGSGSGGGLIHLLLSGALHGWNKGGIF